MRLSRLFAAGVLASAIALSVASKAAHAQFFLDVGTEEFTFSGNARGYWFTAPVDFTITGLRVPTDASSGNQSVQLVRLNAAPPGFPTTTTSFTTLFYQNDDPSTGFIDLSASITAGDIIGVLGTRGGVNSYLTGPYTSSIFGNTVSLARLGTQNPIDTVGAPDLWTETVGNISRVEMRYEASSAAAPEPGTLALLALGGALGILKRRIKN